MIIHRDNFTIQKINSQDLDSIYNVYKNCEDFLSLGPVPKASIQMILDDLKISEDESGIYCGIFLQGKMIGVIDFILAGFEGYPCHAYISLLMISADYRRMGIGKNVVNAVEKEIIKNNSINSILTNVQTNNKYAIIFWERAGYKIVSAPQIMPDTTVTYRLQKNVN